MSDLPDDPEDEQWLSALAGKPDASATPMVNAQAVAMRSAMQARNAKLDAQVPLADTALYEQTLFRLRREGLMKKRPLWEMPQVWGLAATVFIGVIGALQIQGSGEQEADQLTRGLGDGVSLIISADPEETLIEVLSKLHSEGVTTEAVERINGEIKITIPSTIASLDAIEKLRIPPPPQSGKIIIVISKPKTGRDGESR
jgi:hypothetical protein